MPSDYQPPPFSLPRLVKANQVKSFESIVDQVLLVPGEKRVFTCVKEFSSGKVRGFDPYEVSIVVAKLQSKNLYVDYGVEMDDKYCRDYIVIKDAPVELKAEAKKL